MALYNDNPDYDDDDFDSEVDSQLDKYITFKIGAEDYAIEIRYVSEIIGIQKISHIPYMPTYLKGIINLRANVIPVIDVRLKFGYIEKSYNDRTSVLIINLNEATIGLIVDEVSEVLDIPANQIDPPPIAGKQTKNRYIKGFGKVADTVIIILDISNILPEEEFNVILNANIKL
ncbi:MAG: chemotaxis protein CheW [Candidatus Kapabacteria bacterium]|nr:chemotaxis protein CheW [Candidatus Kapabacteria bacterium]